MTRRALFVLDFQRLTERQLGAIEAAVAQFDEIILAVSNAEQAYTEEHPLRAGERISRLRDFLTPKISIPLFILPLKTGGLSMAQVALRLPFEVPAFEALWTDSPFLARAASALLGCSIELLKPSGSDLLASEIPERERGLFIARAQPFHLGHAACVERIADEMDEVIVLVALSNRSHSLQNPATAGERLTMIRPYLERALPGRYYLAAAPYEPYDAANVGELQLLLPTFARIYSNRPSTQAMAKSAGVPSTSIRTTHAISATRVRHDLAAGLDVSALLPPEVAAVLAASQVPRRLRALAVAEMREDD